MFSKFIYESWKKLQMQKYKDLFPEIKKYLSNEFEVLDYGIGKAWLEEFLSERDFVFKKITGFDIEERAVSPRKEGIEYYIGDELKIKEKFDFVIAFDSLHTTQDPVQIMKFSKRGGLVLISEPEKFKKVLEKFSNFEKLESGEIGEVEKDRFILIKNK